MGSGDGLANETLPLSRAGSSAVHDMEHDIQRDIERNIERDIERDIECDKATDTASLPSLADTAAKLPRADSDAGVSAGGDEQDLHLCVRRRTF